MANAYDEKAREVLAIPRFADIDWYKLGRETRISADDAHEGDTPDYQLAWEFCRDNPECAGYDQWPSSFPEFAPLAWIDGYLSATGPFDPTVPAETEHQNPICATCGTRDCNGHENDFAIADLNTLAEHFDDLPVSVAGLPEGIDTLASIAWYIIEEQIRYQTGKCSNGHEPQTQAPFMCHCCRYFKQIAAKAAHVRSRL